jgi:hypothetical protein
MSTLMKRGKSMYTELKEEIGKGYTAQLHDKVSCLWLWALAPAPAIPQQHPPACSCPYGTRASLAIIQAKTGSDRILLTRLLNFEKLRDKIRAYALASPANTGNELDIMVYLARNWQGTNKRRRGTR